MLATSTCSSLDSCSLLHSTAVIQTWISFSGTFACPVTDRPTAQPSALRLAASHNSTTSPWVPTQHPHRPSVTRGRSIPSHNSLLCHSLPASIFPRHMTFPSTGHHHHLLSPCPSLPGLTVQNCRSKPRMISRTMLARSTRPALYAEESRCKATTMPKHLPRPESCTLTISHDNHLINHFLRQHCITLRFTKKHGGGVFFA